MNVRVLSSSVAVALVLFLFWSVDSFRDVVVSGAALMDPVESLLLLLEEVPWHEKRAATANTANEEKILAFM
jgi:hypothetical protein